MSQTHWKKLQNPDYIGAYAFVPGQDIIATIKNVKQEKIPDTNGKKEDCSVIHFSEKIKPLVLNSTNSKTIEKLYKTPYIEEWQGRKIQLYVEKVKAFGDVVDAVRIRPFVPNIQVQTTVCVDCGKSIEPIGDRTPEYLAQYTASKYGKPLCSACASRAAEDKTKKVVENPLDEDDVAPINNGDTESDGDSNAE